MATSKHKDTLPHGTPINDYNNRDIDNPGSGTIADLVKRSICIITHLDRKGRWKRSISSSDQPKGSQPICGVDILKDGTPPSCKMSPLTWRSQYEVGFKGCLLHIGCVIGSMSIHQDFQNGCNRHFLFGCWGFV